MQALAQRRAGLPASTSSRGPSSSSHHHAAPLLLRRSQRKLRPTILAFAAVDHHAGVVVDKQPNKNTREQQLELPLPRAVENAADDPSLHNPLERMERLSTGWFGIIADYAGVVVEDTADAHAAAWLAVADEMGLARPLGQTLRRIRGVRDEVVVMQMFNWTRNPGRAADLAALKAERYDALLDGRLPAAVPGSAEFLSNLAATHKVPLALATAEPEARVRAGLERAGLARAFDAVVTGEDSGAPEAEYYYMAAAQRLQRPFVRCIVVGASNRAVEAAHELGMKVVVVAGAGAPAWDYAGADLVVRSLGQLSFVNLKRLFGSEDLVEPAAPFEDDGGGGYVVEPGGYGGGGGAYGGGDAGRDPFSSAMPGGGGGYGGARDDSWLHYD